MGKSVKERIRKKKFGKNSNAKKKNQLNFFQKSQKIEENSTRVLIFSRCKEKLIFSIVNLSNRSNYFLEASIQELDIKGNPKNEIIEVIHNIKYGGSGNFLFATGKGISMLESYQENKVIKLRIRDVLRFKNVYIKKMIELRNGTILISYSILDKEMRPIEDKLEIWNFEKKELLYSINLNIRLNLELLDLIIYVNCKMDKL